jgi:hypothetical protein
VKRARFNRQIARFLMELGHTLQGYAEDLATRSQERIGVHWCMDPEGHVTKQLGTAERCANPWCQAVDEAQHAARVT